MSSDQDFPAQCAAVQAWADAELRRALAQDIADSASAALAEARSAVEVKASVVRNYVDRHEKKLYRTTHGHVLLTWCGDKANTLEILSEISAVPSADSGEN